jgi:hypothetical protein
MSPLTDRRNPLMKHEVTLRWVALIPLAIFAVAAFMAWK